MTAPYILARTFGEAHAFAQDELGVGRGYYRVVTSPSSVKGPRGADLYLVPGWEKRFDRFAMAGALKWTRLHKIDVAEWRLEQADPRGPLTERALEVAYRYNRLLAETDGLEPAGNTGSLLSPEEIAELESHLEPEGWEPPETLNAEQILRLAAGESGADVAPAEEPVKRRRRRCADCGLLVEPDEVESHAADHAADLVSLGRNPEGV